MSCPRIERARERRKIKIMLRSPAAAPSSDLYCSKRNENPKAARELAARTRPRAHLSRPKMPGPKNEETATGTRVPPAHIELTMDPTTVARSRRNHSEKKPEIPEIPKKPPGENAQAEKFDSPQSDPLLDLCVDRLPSAPDGNTILHAKMN